MAHRTYSEERRPKIEPSVQSLAHSRTLEAEREHQRGHIENLEADQVKPLAFLRRVRGRFKGGAESLES